MDDTNDRPFLSETHGGSRRTAVFEDTGVVAYLYLTSPDSDSVAADAWVYNRIEAPSADDVQRYRPGPPPAAADDTAAEGHVPQPAVRVWSFEWAPDGHSVAICADGIAQAFIRNGRKPGFSRHLRRSGPWGEPWSADAYAATFISR